MRGRSHITGGGGNGIKLHKWRITHGFFHFLHRKSLHFMPLPPPPPPPPILLNQPRGGGFPNAWVLITVDERGGGGVKIAKILIM